MNLVACFPWLCAWDRVPMKAVAISSLVSTVDAVRIDEADESDGSVLVTLMIFATGVALAAYLAACLVRRETIEVKVCIEVATQTEERAEPSERIECIYVTSSGEKFHFSSGCHGLRSRSSPLRCYKPCKLCTSGVGGVG